MIPKLIIFATSRSPFVSVGGILAEHLGGGRACGCPRRAGRPRAASARPRRARGCAARSASSRPRAADARPRRRTPSGSRGPARCGSGWPAGSGSMVESRPVAATAWLNVVCRRPSAPISVGSGPRYVLSSFESSRHSSITATISCSARIVAQDARVGRVARSCPSGRASARASRTGSRATCWVEPSMNSSPASSYAFASSSSTRSASRAVISPMRYVSIRTPASSIVGQHARSAAARPSRRASSSRARAGARASARRAAAAARRRGRAPPSPRRPPARAGRSTPYSAARSSSTYAARPGSIR